MPENASGKLSAALATDITTIQALTGETVGIIVKQFCVFLATVVISFSMGDWQCTLLVFACVPLMGMAMSVWVLMASGEIGGVASMGQEAGKIVGEVTGNTRTMTSFTLEQRFIRDFSQANAK